MDVVNGYSDHFHCLISLSSNQNIENIVQLIKGESSYWINKNCLTKKNLHGKKNILRFLFQNQWLNKFKIILKTNIFIIRRKPLKKNIKSLEKNIILSRFRLKPMENLIL